MVALYDAGDPVQLPDERQKLVHEHDFRTFFEAPLSVFFKQRRVRRLGKAVRFVDSDSGML